MSQQVNPRPSISFLSFPLHSIPLPDGQHNHNLQCLSLAAATLHATLRQRCIRSKNSYLSCKRVRKEAILARKIVAPWRTEAVLSFDLVHQALPGLDAVVFLLLEVVRILRVVQRKL